MWFNLLSMGVKTASHIYQNKQRTSRGWKDEFVLVLISIPILILGYSVFTDDPEIRNRLDIFFEYFKQLPYWYQAIFIGVVSAIYGLKGADIMRKPK